MAKAASVKDTTEKAAAAPKRRRTPAKPPSTRTTRTSRATRSPKTTRQAVAAAAAAVATEEDAAASASVASPPPSATKARATGARSRSRTKAKAKTKAKEEATPPASTPPPTATIIIDNGGSTLKYGWAHSDEQAQMLPNVTARLPHQLTVLVGDELSQVNNPTSLHSHTRSTERGIICNMGNQAQVWKRVLNKLNVSYPTNSEAAKALGWMVGGGKKGKAAANKRKRKQQAAATTDDDNATENTMDAEQNGNASLVPSHALAVLLLLPPNYPRILLDQIMYVWMEDFGVSHVGFAVSQACASVRNRHDDYKTCVCVDLGWSATQIVPTFQSKLISHAKSNKPAYRRIPIGGRHMINMMKYYMTYRQYNLMDQEFILTDVFQRLMYVSLDYDAELQLARQSKIRRYDRDYVLPDYQTTHEGQIQLPPQLQRQMEAEQKQGEVTAATMGNEDDDEEEEDDDYNENDGDNDDDDDDDGDGDGGDDNDIDATDSHNATDMIHSDDEDEDEDEETPAQKRQRIMQQRAEEERRKREMEMEQQLLRISVERFTVPEVLFRPLDAGLTTDLVGLAVAVHQAVQSCPKPYRPALYKSILLTGGICQLPNLKERLQKELRQLVPNELDLVVGVTEDPLRAAWDGARWMVRNATAHTEWSVSRQEWETCSRRRAYKRLVDGGMYA